MNKIKRFRFKSYFRLPDFDFYIPVMLPLGCELLVNKERKVISNERNK